MPASAGRQAPSSRQAPAARPAQTAGNRPGSARRPRPGPAASHRERPAGENRTKNQYGRYGETASANVRRKTQNKRRASKIYLFLAVGAVIAAIVLALTVFFNVNEIEVRGNSRYSSEQVIEYSGISIGDNLLLMDKFSSADSIRKNLLYIGGVEIRRSFPDKIIINVTEISVAAAFDAGGAYWLCDSGGILLELSQSLPDGAAADTGAELEKPAPGSVFQTSDGTKQQPLEQLFKALENNNLFGSVYSIDISKIYDIKINYMDRYEIAFGKTEDLDGSCRKLRELILQLEAEGNMNGTIDMSGGEIHFIAK
jgi:cell division protein FtsQ